MAEKPLISVIVPIYNVEAYIRTCVESLLGQTYTNLEIILVEDGSPDNCAAICDEYAAKDPRIKVVHKKNGGVSSARNAGLAAVTGDLIAFVDGDDFVSPDIYTRMYGVMEEDPRLDVVYTACTRYPAQEQLLHMDFYPTGTVLTGEEMTRDLLTERVTSHMWLGLFKRFCWEGIVFPEGRTYEDLSMTYRAFKNVQYVYFLKEPLYYYRSNDVSITQKVNPKKLMHIFMAFRDRYVHIRECYPDLAGLNCARASHYAISTYFHYCATKEKVLEAAIPEVRAFLDSHKQTVRTSWQDLPRTRRLALQVYYISPWLFRLGARTLHVTGLQEKLGFQMK